MRCLNSFYDVPSSTCISDMVKMAKGNLKALNEEDKQSLSIPASITNKIAQLQEKIDDYEGQIQNLKRELKTQN
ncbi:unnamed protein product [Rotaria sp. Silwood1]|nr:unnamed protein product [Rotaria sp. Silwood1]